MKKWGLMIDVEKCEDCNNCFLSCKDEHVDNEWPGYALAQPRHGHRWVNIMRKERGEYPMIDVAYLPIPCMHCDNAPCIKAAGDGAIYKREDGIVIIDPVKSRGREELPKSCPYEAIWWNEEKQIPQKCTLCAHLLDQGWKEPRCVQSCPTGALRIVRAEDPEMADVVRSEGLEFLNPQFKTLPRVYYKNLHRYTKCFIGGSVAFDREGVRDCAQGARVLLMKGSERVGEALTDTFGDFSFDRLEEKSGEYIIEIGFESYPKRIVKVDLQESHYAGTIVL